MVKPQKRLTHLVRAVLAFHHWKKKRLNVNLPHDSMFKLKTTVMDNAVLERTRRLFLFSYYCYGISFIDAALLTKKNIIRYNGGNYIVYKRNKTKEAKKVKPIQIKITPEIQELMNWFSANTLLVEDYLLPIVSIAGYKGEQLYNHIRSRFGRNNKNLANLAKFWRLRI